MTERNSNPDLLSVGTYEEMREKVLTNDSLDWTFIPPLISIIMHFHNKQSGVLSQEEVERIRDRSAVVALLKGMRQEQAIKRGYDDIMYPEHVWVEYLYHIGVLPVTEDKK